MDLQNSTANNPFLEEKAILLFSWIDYSIFGCMLSVSVLIGIYYGCFGSKQSTTKEYFFGGKSMKIFPIAMSLVASHLSGITILGIPAEVYLHGTQYWMCIISITLVIIIIWNVYLPVFYKLQLVSSYEYLKLRFDHKVRTLASLLFVVANLLYVPLVIYIPALAFNQVTKIEISKICPLICLVCIFYTTIGGLKAVVLSDALQFTVTLVTMTTIIIIGTYSSGSFVSIWEKASRTDRLEFFNMSMDPTERTTFWGITVGMTAIWISNLGLNPSSIQRFLSLPSWCAAKRSMVIFALGVIITKSISCFTGLLMFAKYSDCDPLLNGSIKRSDQLLPYYVLDVASHIPGLPGLFLAGVFCTALSTMSSQLNTLAGTIYQDFIKSHMPESTTEKTASNIMKVIVVVVGLLSLGLVFVVEKLGGVVEVSLSLHGITAGPLLGLFTLGMLFPFANAHGALYGGVASTLCVTILVAGAQLSAFHGTIKHAKKPLSVEGCFNNNSVIISTVPTVNDEEPFGIFLISFYFHSLIGTILVLLFGLPISWITRKQDVILNPDLISPSIHWLLPKNINKKQSLNYDTIDVALKKVFDVHESKNCTNDDK